MWPFLVQTGAAQVASGVRGLLKIRTHPGRCALAAAVKQGFEHARLYWLRQMLVEPCFL
jgi:hypothetical protein